MESVITGLMVGLGVYLAPVLLILIIGAMILIADLFKRKGN